MDREALQERFGLIGESQGIKQVIDKVLQIADTDITVLLQGETGVGKDVTARAIHKTSNRKHNDLVIVNCGAIPEGLIESELFGHEKGAFTGAHESRKGYFEKADKGTVFLDEIGDMPKNVQVKLLRVLENGEFSRVGSSKMQTTDVRVIAATNQDLWEMVEEGDFRQDLYYRLETVKIRIPPLRERKDDILLIFRKFIDEFSSKYDSVFRGFSDEARKLLSSYRWPGNIRELRNVAEQLVVLEKSKFVDADVLQNYLKGRQRSGHADNLPVLAQQSDRSDDEQSSQQNDQQLIYRVLVELRSEMSDIKRMLGTIFYGSMSKSNQPKALPEHIPGSIDPSATGMGAGASSGKGMDSSDITDYVNRAMGRDEQDATAENSDYEEEDEFKQFFEGEIPSFEETERFLIEQALKHFKGNRRKASEALGVSERTLYRKLDQYDLQ